MSSCCIFSALNISSDEYRTDEPPPTAVVHLFIIQGPSAVRFPVKTPFSPSKTDFAVLLTIVRIFFIDCYLYSGGGLPSQTTIA
jgi:hypothetical protein